MTFISPFYRTLTTTALGMCALINVKICSGSISTASGVLILTMALTSVTLSMHWRVAGWALAAILAYVGFASCTVGVPHDFMASSMCLSLSFTTFWFLLCLVHNS